MWSDVNKKRVILYNYGYYSQVIMIVVLEMTGSLIQKMQKLSV